LTWKKVNLKYTNEIPETDLPKINSAMTFYLRRQIMRIEHFLKIVKDKVYNVFVMDIDQFLALLLSFIMFLGLMGFLFMIYFFNQIIN
jgi:hypothetical protein